MGTIMQRIRDRIFNQAIIIVQRQSGGNISQDEVSSLDESGVNDISKDTQENSVTENVRTGPNEKEESKSSGVQQNITDNISHNKENSEKKIITRGKDNLKSSESKEFEVYLTSLFGDLKCDNSLETRCSGALNLALCFAYDSPDIEFVDCLEALKDLCDSHNYPHLAVCHALLLCSLTKMSMSLEDLIKLEESIMSFIEPLKRENITKIPEMYKVGVLVKDHKEVTLKLCQEVFRDGYLDLEQMDISTICCCSLHNLSSLVKQYDNDLGATYNFKDSTLKYILVMIGRSTQEFVYENMNSSSEKYSRPSMSSHRLKQCLQVLEHALSINPDLTYREALQHECSSLPYCLTRLLGWSVSSVFPVTNKTYEEADSNYFAFHLSTLVCILKILSILTFNPHQYDSFSNVKGLMEKILICTLKAYFESERNHFDIQILCLELLINLYIKNQKTFIVLCLKKFRISDTEEILAVEALLKMLSDNLEKIKEVKERYPQRNNKNESNEESGKESEDALKEDPIKKPRKETVEDAARPTEKHRTEAESSSSNASKEKSGKDTAAETDAILQAASKDMEHSTIVSFICVLIVFFMRTKQNFKEFILERLSTESLKEATIVSQKFLEFASLTGGMPVTGILILSQTITKLQSLQSS